MSVVKQHTKMKCGKLVAIYVQDGQGRRLVVARIDRHQLVVEGTLVLAETQAEARQAIAALYQLLEELPP